VNFAGRHVQNYSDSGLRPSSGILNTTKRFGKWIIFPSSCEGTKTPAQLGPLEGANLSHWTTHVNVKAKVILRPTVSRPVIGAGLQIFITVIHLRS
jgi:hypothetical protein